MGRGWLALGVAAFVVGCADEESLLYETHTVFAGAGGAIAGASGHAVASGTGGGVLAGGHQAGAAGVSVGGASSAGAAGSGGTNLQGGAAPAGAGGASGHALGGAGGDTTIAGSGGAAGAGASTGGSANVGGSGGAVPSGGAGGLAPSGGAGGSTIDGATITSVDPTPHQVRQGFGDVAITFHGAHLDAITSVSAGANVAAITAQSASDLTVVVTVAHGAALGPVDVALDGDIPYPGLFAITKIIAKPSGDDAGAGTDDNPFATLKQALFVAGGEDTVALDGAFDPSIGFADPQAIVPDGVAVEGSADGDTILSCAAPFTAFATTGSATVRNLTIQGCNGVAVHGAGVVSVRNVAVHGAPGAAIAVDLDAGAIAAGAIVDVGAAIDPTLPACALSDSGEGLEVEDGAVVTVTGCTIENNTGNGVDARGGKVVLDTDTVSKNGDPTTPQSNGVVASGTADVTITNSLVTANVRAGLSLLDAATVHVTGSHLDGNATIGMGHGDCFGVLLDGGASVDFSATTISQNLCVGIYASGSAAITARDGCAINDGPYGVYFDDGSGLADLGDTSFARDTTAAILVSGASTRHIVIGAPVDPSGALVTDRAAFVDDGIAVAIGTSGAATVLVQHADFLRDADGVVLSNTGAVELTVLASTFTESTLSAVLIGGEAASVTLGGVTTGADPLGLTFVGNPTDPNGVHVGTIADERTATTSATEMVIRASFADSATDTPRTYGPTEFVGPKTSANAGDINVHYALNVLVSPP